MNQETLKNISWEYDDLFSYSDKEELKTLLDIDENELNTLLNYGKSRNSPDGSNLGMWFYDKDGNPINYFTKIYTKLACCTGQSSIQVPYLDSTGQTAHSTLTVTPSDCTIGGIDWKDDNSTPEGYNQYCHRLIQRLLAFLYKYEPNNPLTSKYDGCMANSYVDNQYSGLKSVPYIWDVVNINRRCLITECNKPGVYIPKKDRYPCTTTICNAEIGIRDSDVNKVKILNNKISQECGPESKLYKSLQGGGDLAEEVNYENVEGGGSNTTGGSSGNNSSDNSSSSEGNNTLYIFGFIVLILIVVSLM